ncbi:MAG: hypothetical protein Tsb0034_08810 [Ekhidna sp.]
MKLQYPKLKIDFKSKVGPNVLIKCGLKSSIKITNSAIERGSVIVADHGGIIKIDSSFIGGHSWIIARRKITISEGSQIAEHTSIRDNDHVYGVSSITESGFNLSEVFIGKNVWLGSKTTVIKGSVINDNVVVGANSVVRGVLDANSVYAGIPTIKIKSF